MSENRQNEFYKNSVAVIKSSVEDNNQHRCSLVINLFKVMEFLRKLQLIKNKKLAFGDVQLYQIQSYRPLQAGLV